MNAAACHLHRAGGNLDWRATSTSIFPRSTGMGMHTVTTALFVLPITSEIEIQITRVLSCVAYGMDDLDCLQVSASLF